MSTFREDIQEESANPVVERVTPHSNYKPYSGSRILGLSFSGEESIVWGL